MTIVDIIEREHIIKALEQIDREGVPPKQEATGYDLIYEGKKYPPKYVIRLANKFVEGKELRFDEHHGGEQTNKILREFGFDVVVKIDFPKINDNLSIDKLAQIYQDIEEGRPVNPVIRIPPLCNVIPATEKGDCLPTLIGIIIDKRDFEKRMPKILASIIICSHRQVILVASYWDGIAWENIWREPFEDVCKKAAVGTRVYMQMYDGLPLRII